MIQISLLTISAVFIWFARVKRSINVYSIYYLGMIIFIFIGWISAYYLADNFYLLNGNRDILDNIIVNMFILFIVNTILLLIPHKKPEINQNAKDHHDLKKIFVSGKFVKWVYMIGFILSVLILFSIEIKTAPLFNIAKYNAEEMSYYRSVLYANESARWLSIPRYLLLYLIIPISFLLRGIGHRVPLLFLLLFSITSLLTLSKTAFILIVLFYFVGKWISTKKVKYLIYLVIVAIISFYLIVYFTYYLDVKRNFFDILNVFYLRLVVAPISISAYYSEIFSFYDNIRSSIYYTYVFGGEFKQIPIIAANLIMGETTSNMPTGLLGSAYPNVPIYLHWFYYMLISLFMLFASQLTNYVSGYYLRNIFMFIIGILSWFLYLTEPLVALNSYGILYVFLCLIIYLIFKRKIRI